LLHGGGEIRLYTITGTGGGRENRFRLAQNTDAAEVFHGTAVEQGKTGMNSASATSALFGIL